MNKYIFRLTYTDGYTKDLTIEMSDLPKAWCYAMGQAAMLIESEHGDLKKITKVNRLCLGRC